MHYYLFTVGLRAFAAELVARGSNVVDDTAIMMFSLIVLGSVDFPNSLLDCFAFLTIVVVCVLTGST